VGAVGGVEGRPCDRLTAAGVIHHAYDAYLGAYAIDRGWQVWMLPIRCHHYGGQTAVGDAGYQQWAKQQTIKGIGVDPETQELVTIEGDTKLWIDAHRIVYDLLRGVLPLRIQE
jgi:hypothetical protein